MKNLAFNGVGDIKNQLEEIKNGLVGILDGSLDDIGARANFGKASPVKGDAFEQFMMKFSNF